MLSKGQFLNRHALLLNLPLVLTGPNIILELVVRMTKTDDVDKALREGCMAQTGFYFIDKGHFLLLCPFG